MARFQVVKGGPLSWTTNRHLFNFTTYVTSCVARAGTEIAMNISAVPLAAIGTEPQVRRMSGSVASNSADAFATSNPASHANAFARHFLATNGRTTRMDYGNTVEQRAYALMQSSGWWYGNRGYVEGQHYLYNESNAIPPLFPINYRSGKQSGRPDFR